MPAAPYEGSLMSCSQRRCHPLTQLCRKRCILVKFCCGLFNIQPLDCFLPGKETKKWRLRTTWSVPPAVCTGGSMAFWKLKSSCSWANITSHFPIQSCWIISIQQVFTRFSNFPVTSLISLKETRRQKIFSIIFSFLIEPQQIGLCATTRSGTLKLCKVFVLTGCWN